MGLHQKSRDFLFQEFVNRSYQGASAQLRKALIALGPDKILLQKDALHNTKEELDQLNDFFTLALREAHETADARLLGILKTTLESPYIAWYTLDKTLQNGTLVLENGLGKKSPPVLNLISEWNSSADDLPGKSPVRFVGNRSPLSAALEEQGLPKNPSFLFPKKPLRGFLVVGGKEAALKKSLARPFVQILVKMLIYFHPQTPVSKPEKIEKPEKSPGKPKKA